MKPKEIFNVILGIGTEVGYGFVIMSLAFLISLLFTLK